jgi:peptide chain release factor 2
MEGLLQKLEQLKLEVDSACKRIHLSELQAEQSELANKAAAPDFWNNQIAAQEVTKKLAKLEARIKPWAELTHALNDAIELARLSDTSLQDDLQSMCDEAQNKFETLKYELKFGGKYDDHDVIMNIFAGAGGTDAQDWAEMLVRMYVRWAEAHNDTKVEVIEESRGDEAGIKSVTLSVSGPLIYGKLKGENGVHRLVRLSPFNSDNLRQTSFAKVDVLPKIDAPDEVAIDEKDLKIDVYRAGGHGGQSVNTTDSAVRITHVPTGITVAIQNERSQLQNKETALTILRSRLAQLQLEQHAEKLSELKGPNEQAAWGNQIRNYVLHPYKQVKDVRSKYETSDTQAVLDGKIDPFITAYLEASI